MFVEGLTVTDNNKNTDVDVHAVAETVASNLGTIEQQIERVTASKANANANANATFFKAAPQNADAANKNKQLIGDARAEAKNIKEENANALQDAATPKAP
jgi:hypothetical protein